MTGPEEHDASSGPPINVVVARTSADVMTEGFVAAVAARPDMRLVENRCLSVEGRADIEYVDLLLASMPTPPQCAVILIGRRRAQLDDLARRWLAQRADLAVMLVDIVDDIVRIAVRDPRLDSLLTVLRGLAERAAVQGQDRVVRIQLQHVETGEDHADATVAEIRPSPLLEASIEWVHQLLRDAVERVPVDNGDVHGLSITRTTLLQSLDAPAERAVSAEPRGLASAEASLDAALDAADPTIEPLAQAALVFGLQSLDFRMMVLALAPELDFRFQRCIGFLLDEMGRRVGTFGLYTTLLGASTRVRAELAHSGALDRWRVFETSAGQRPPADESLRVDPFLARWLLGERRALGNDPRLQRLMRLDRWLGASLLQRSEERARASSLIKKLQTGDGAQWLLLNGTDPAGWRALLERGAAAHRVAPIRIEASRLAGLDVVDVEDVGRRAGRLARLTGHPVVVDLTGTDLDEGHDDALHVFFTALGRTGCRAAVICGDDARAVRLIGAASFELIPGEPLSREAIVDAVRAAARGADAYLGSSDAEAFATRYPLHVDGFEQALYLARMRPLVYDSDDPRLARFTGAAKELVAEGLSHLADRIEPIFDLDDVILPADRRSQLVEVVDNVRFAHQVLDEWKFGEQLPYGRGVTALFFGPSGTGKTMAAMGIARRLNVQILRLDLSRVVSKYIGDTEKNIDRVFTDAQRSGSAILIDEADALLGKRSEVKDAHDRYANIEVAFVLQRMEAYRGLAILTTNMRQGLDPAFLRRLRFIVEFPRPDVEAREKIWRLCLPAGAHTLDDAAFRQLARKVDVTGGNIRQITLRAAFIAAAAGSPIALVHIAQATRAELAKLGMPPADLDLAQARQAA